MNRFNKIMLLGLLSIVTGATSVNGMGGQFAAVRIGDANSKFFAMPNPCGSPQKDAAFANAQALGITKFISLTKSNNKSGAQVFDFETDQSLQSTISTYLDSLNTSDIICVYPKYQQIVTTFDQIGKEEKAKIATLYACWMIKNGASCPVDGIVNLNGQEVKLTDKQNLLVLNYFAVQNVFILGTSAQNPELQQPVEQNPKLQQPVEQNPKLHASSSSKAGKIAFTVAAAYLAYLAIGSIVYNHANCTDESSSLPCTATAHANDVSIATYEFLAAAVAATGYPATAIWNWIKQLDQQLRILPAKRNLPLGSDYLPAQPNCSQFDRPVDLPTCSLGDKLAEQPSYWDALTAPQRNLFHALTGGYFKNN